MFSFRPVRKLSSKLLFFSAAKDDHKGESQGNLPHQQLKLTNPFSISHLFCSI